MTAPLSTSQLRVAWGPACRFDQARFTFWTGVAVTVDRRILAACQALDDCFRAADYRPTPPDVGAYVCRQITGGTGYSLHAFGIAIDVNWNDNPYSASGRLITDMPPAMIGRIVGLRTRSGAPVWGWGGAYRTIKDPMHFEIVCTPADLATGLVNTVTVTDSGGFGTMTDAEIDAKFLNLAVANKEQAEELAAIRADARRHNERARERDKKLLAVLERIAAKLDA